ncbi:hypothetical protein JTM69_32695, partial [Pseudomonas aeruginosa]|nr:hypothetical protein [Pseudomonas aeruginosa]
GARGGQKRRTERVTWSILIDGPLSKAARAEVDRKYRVTSDLPQCNGAPLHHFHCDCSFGFEIISAITVPQ